MVPLGTSVAPGHNTLQLIVAHNRATRVTLTESVECDTKEWQTVLIPVLEYSVAYLARILASFQVTSAEHGICDHAWVGVFTVPVRQDGDV